MPTKPPTDYRRKVLSSLAWQGSAQLVGQVISWASTILVIRLLDPEDYGLMSMATLFVSFVLMLSDLGIGAAIVQAEELDEEDLRTVQGLVLCFNGVGLAATLLGSSLVASFFDEPGLVGILNALSVNFVLLALYVLPSSRLIRDLRFDRKAKVDLLTLVASAATSLAFAWNGFGVWSLVAGTLMTHFTRAVGYNWMVRDPVRPKFSFARGRRFIAFGSVIVLDRLLWFLYSNMDITIAGKLLGTELLGFYSVALTLAAIPLDKIVPVLTQVAFPAIARIQNDPERVRRNMLRAIRYGNLVFLPVFWGMAWVGADALPLFLGAQWERAVTPFQLICVILPPKAIAALFPPALFGAGRPGVSAANMAIGLVLLTGGFIVGSRWGLTGLAASWLLVYPLVFVITTTRALPVLGLRWRDLASACHGALIAALLMSAAVWLIQVGSMTWASPVRLIFTILGGACVYTFTIFAIDRSAIADLRDLFAR